MKAFQRGNKIVFSKNENYKEMERAIQLLSEEFERLKNICEDRATETFPAEVIKRIVEKGNELREMGKDIEIPEDYMRFMIEEKNVLRYFEGIVQKAEKEVCKYEEKTERLRKFAEMLDN
ncbi:uncharacterized protein VICG_00636 [Vittaforma corneae ATCC 50505]|uniref:Uncharacterized protein n=1 Tax=Vittaforma corneae (strain ATCC 50505) TaxID=993615 RepID=L2GPK4_VITCO|nr:uncharacterized protein VICG_00636 [Vittaforma corneae ATCC 50505]ELA42237.1 hypothetical protein VICG_00636 [Vittaforma corneae ATCC 50505]